MLKKQIILLGGGGHAKQILGTLLRLPEYEVVGFLDDDESKIELFGIKRLGSLLPVADTHPTKLIALGIGHVGKTELQRKIVNAYKSAGYVFETIVSPTAIIVPFGVEIGEGSYIGDSAIVQPDAKIGKYSIINNFACVNHECRIGDHVHVAPGAMISGNVTIGHNTMIGTGSSVVQGARIGNDVIIGMGTAIIRDCQDRSVHTAFGSKEK